VRSADDWQRCGANGEGDLGELANQVEEAKAHLRSAQSRINGQRDKIKIDQEALARTQHVHEDTLNFIQSNGEALSALTLLEGVVNAEEKCVEIASQASVMNAGAPIGEAAVAAVLELQKAGLEAQKQQLQTAQQMRFEQASAQIELINGMAAIQKETIDLAQFAVDMQSDMIALAALSFGSQPHAASQGHVGGARSGARDRRTRSGQRSELPHSTDQQSEELLGARAEAARELYLAGLALEYEINRRITPIGPAVLRASNNLALSGVHDCMRGIFTQWRMSFGQPQDVPETISIRKMLGSSRLARTRSLDKFSRRASSFASFSCVTRISTARAGSESSSQPTCNRATASGGPTCAWIESLPCRPSSSGTTSATTARPSRSAFRVGASFARAVRTSSCPGRSAAPVRSRRRASPSFRRA